MLDNEARLGGVVTWVRIKPAKSWVNCTLKLQHGDTKHSVKVSGINLGDRVIERIENLKGKAIIIRGRMGSYTLKARPPEYPKDRVVFELGMGKNAYFMAQEQYAQQVNQAFFCCKVQKSKTDSDNRLRALVKIRYAKPDSKEFGTYSARVRCPEGIEELGVDEEVWVTGRLVLDDLGVLVDAHAVVRRP